MKVKVIEKDTGKVIGEFSINYRLLNAKATENECQDEAWQCAIEDKLVKNENRKNYEFLISKD